MKFNLHNIGSWEATLSSLLHVWEFTKQKWPESWLQGGKIEALPREYITAKGPNGSFVAYSLPVPSLICGSIVAWRAWMSFQNLFLQWCQIIL